MVCHDSIRCRFSYPAIRYLSIPQNSSIRYRSISIDIIILYTYCYLFVTTIYIFINSQMQPKYMQYATRKQPLMCLSLPRLTLGAEESVFLVPHGPTIAPRCPTAVIADKIKRMHFQKESKSIFLPTISVLPLCSQSSQPFQPLATWVEAWQAIPGGHPCRLSTVCQRG